MGEVYDVSNGRDHYGPGASYSAFAGKEGSVSFVTGVFTEEEMKKSMKDLTISQLQQVYQWRVFYQREDKYPFVGFLLGRYFNAMGEPTKALKKVRKRLENAARDQAKQAAFAKFQKYQQEQAEAQARATSSKTHVKGEVNVGPE
jgi:hypothetical protein